MFHPEEQSLAAIALDDGAELGEGQLEHVRSCAECSAAVAELQQAVVLVRAGTRGGPLEPPPPGVWSRVEAEIDASEAATPVLRLHQRRRALPLPWGAGLAAAGIAIGLLTGRALWQEPPPPAVTTVATAELDTLDTQRRLGDATLLRTDAGVDLRVATSPLDPGAGFLEVWLINTDGKRMVSVGVLGGEGTETFPVSQTLLDQGYLIVDISREGFDDRPEHSGDSLARGTLAT